MLDEIAALNSLDFQLPDTTPGDMEAACNRALATCSEAFPKGFATRENCCLDLSHIGRVLFYTRECLNTYAFTSNTFKTDVPSKPSPTQSIPSKPSPTQSIPSKSSPVHPSQAKPSPTQPNPAKPSQAKSIPAQPSPTHPIPAPAEDTEDSEDGDGGEPDDFLIPQVGEICVGLVDLEKESSDSARILLSSSSDIKCYFFFVTKVIHSKTNKGIPDDSFIVHGKYYAGKSLSCLNIRKKNEIVTFLRKHFLHRIEVSGEAPKSLSISSEMIAELLETARSNGN
jgi:hypothetical protein